MAIYKNLKLGELLITHYEGRHLYEPPKDKKTFVEIFSHALYTPSLRDEEEFAKDITIRIAGEQTVHSYQTLAKILALQVEIDRLKEQKEKATTQEAEELVKRIHAKEVEKQDYLDKAQSFIRKYAELRYQPILDPTQEKIKRSKLFDGPLIINGGPGTGKTTSLIQRIKFLTEKEAMVEYKTDLTAEQEKVLLGTPNPWVFFSPSELLALFLRNSMSEKGLAAGTETVKVWATYKNELIKTYGLINPETKRPFMMCKRKQEEENLFVNNPGAIKTITRELEDFYLGLQKEKLNKIANIDTEPFYWKQTGGSMKEYTCNKKEIGSIGDMILLFANLNETYKKEADKISEEYTTLVNRIAGKIQVAINKDAERKEKLNQLLRQWKNDKQVVEDEEDDDDSVIESEDFGEVEDASSFDFDSALFSKLKSLCRKQALKKYDSSTRLTKRDKDLLELISEAEHQEEYERMGQTAYFKKYFERLTKGIVDNVLREIPRGYKKFRRTQLVKENPDWNRVLLDELVKKDNNSRIHPEERALLLYFINRICYRLAKTFSESFKEWNHPYIVAYKKSCRPVIGIDEATDFSLIDLLVMNSFIHPTISSVTLSGDIMQRMTTNGIHSWEDFSTLVPHTEKADLNVSYRQSPTLLSLASLIYEKSTGEKANYTSYIRKDKAEPKPLMLVSEDEEEKQEWIAQRIIEIHTAYGGTIPSIAIFLPSEDQLDRFARELGEIEELEDRGISVKACKDGEVLGEESFVRVFAIDKIKGLEFEAVFFHNPDELQEQELDNELLLKYLYVGLSRATFYLGMTVSDELPADMAFMENSFDRSGATWKTVPQE